MSLAYQGMGIPSCLLTVEGGIAGAAMLITCDFSCRSEAARSGNQTMHRFIHGRARLGLSVGTDLSFYGLTSRRVIEKGANKLTLHCGCQTIDKWGSMPSVV